MGSTNDTRCSEKYRMEDRQAMTLSRLSPSSKLVCIRGTTWITMAGDHADYFVREGERFSFGRSRKPVISAIGPTEFYVLSKRPHPARLHRPLRADLGEAAR
jgi:hypothetical protein